MGKRLWIAGALLGAAALWIALPKHRPDSPRRPQEHRRNRHSDFERNLQPVASPSRFPRHDLRPGDRLRYEFEYRQEVEMEARVDSVVSGLTVASPPAIPARVAVTLVGRMEAIAREREGESLWLEFLFPELSLASTASQGAANSEAAEEIAQQMREGFLIQMNPDGSTEDLRLPPAMTTEARSFLKAILAEYTCLCPGKGERSWDAEEQDCTGRYTATYRVEEWVRSPTGEYARLAKAKRYHDLFRGRTAALEESAPSFETKGAVSIYFDIVRGHVERISSSQEIALRGAGLLERIDSRSHADFILIERDHDDGLAASVSARSAEFASTLPGGEEELAALVAEAEEARDREFLDSGMDAGTAVAALSGAIAQGRFPGAGAYRELRTLTALLRYDESALPSVVGYIRSAPDSVLAQALAGCLGEAGSPPAQQALVEFTRDSFLDPPLRDTAVWALSKSARPVEDAENTLRSLADGSPLASTALLALGTMSRRISATQPDRSERIVAFLEETAAAATEERRLVCIAALENAKSFATLLRRLEQDPSPQVRKACLESLAPRVADDADVREAILRSAGADPDPTVRRQAREILP